jgi:predicted amidohydrolase
MSMPDAGTFIAGCVQMRCTADKQRNLDTAIGLISEAVLRGSSLVVLPELFSWRGPRERDADEAEPLGGPTLVKLCELAKEASLTLVAGSILEKPSRPGSLPCNTSVVIGPKGTVLGAYRKMHLFDVAIPGRVEVRESERFSPGTEPVCVSTEVGKIGLSICYDLRFPELYRRLMRTGAEILCVPSAFTHTTGAAHWEALVRARAIENQCYVLAPNQVGPTAHGPQVWGHSSIVDPWGTVLAQAADLECVITAEISRELLARVRGELPCLAHTRLTV